MKKHIPHLASLHCFAAALFLAGSALTASAQVVATPAKISVALTFNCNQSFLSPWSVLGGSAAAALPTAGTTPPANWPNSCSLSVPNLSGSASIPSSSALGNSSFTLWVNPWVGKFGCGSFQDAFAPFNVNGTLTLSSSSGTESYVLEQPPISPIPPNNFYSYVLPVVPDPSLPSSPPFNQMSALDNPVTLSETPGLLSISLQCPNQNDPLPDFIPGTGRVEAVLNASGIPGIPAHLSPPFDSTTLHEFGPGSADTLQATLTPFIPGGSPAQLLVRSGRNYHLFLYYTTGHFFWSDAINWKLEVPNVPDTSGDPDATVPACTTTPVAGTLITCDVDPWGNCLWPTAIGSVGMSGGGTVWPVITMGAYDGPLDNHRETPPNTVIPTSANCDAFVITNIVPSDFFSLHYPALNVPSRPYFMQGFMNFGQFSDYEYFVTPRLPNQFFLEQPCGNITDLAKQFCLCAGHVNGGITLNGPPDLYNTLPSAFRDLVLYSQVNGNFATSGELISDHRLGGSSHLSASGPDGGSARVLFGGATALGSAGCTFSGQYDLRLAGLSTPAGVSLPSTWTANVLDLIFRNTLTDPEQYLSESLRITDNTFGPQNIVCSQTITHNLDYCFGEVLIKVVNNAPNISAGGMDFIGLSAAGSGQAFSGAYGVSFSAGGKVSINNGTVNEGKIRLFLPEGTYSFQTTLQNSDGSSYNQLPGTFTVNCGWITQTTKGAPNVRISKPPPCPTADFCLNATVTPVDPGHTVAISYKINGGTAVPVTYPGSGVAFVICIPLSSLSPCLNTIEVTALDQNNNQATVETTFVNQPSIIPLTITGCQDIIVNVPFGTTSVPVNYNAAVVGGCPGVTFTCNPPAPGPFPIGVTPVTCTAKDACTETTCTFNVIVKTCAIISSNSITCTSNGQAFNYNFTLSNPANGVPISQFTLTPVSGCFSFNPASFTPVNPIQPGSSENFSTVLTLGAGCPKELCFNVDLFDELGDPICTFTECFDNPALPKITCPEDITVDCTYNSGTQVYYPIPTATSLCCSNLTVSCAPPPGDFPIGVTPVICTAVDSCGQTNTCTFNVTVIGHTDYETLRWVHGDGQTFTANPWGSRANAISVDAAGNSFVAGTFSGNLFWDIIYSGPVFFTSAGGQDAFLAKYDTAGNLLWVRTAGGIGNDAALGVAVDADGNCFVTGTYTDSANFSGQPITGNPGKHIFVAKYDAQGNVLWALPAGGVGQDEGRGVAVDAAGNAYVTGRFEDAAKFDTTTGAPITYLGFGSRDCFIAKYDPAGVIQWVAGSGDVANIGNYIADGNGIAVDPAGKTVWITGFFTASASGSPKFGNTPALYFPSTGFGNAFIAQCDLPSGQLPVWTWARQVFCPSGSASCGSHSGQQIGVDNAGNCYFTAVYNGTAGIGLNPPTATFSVTPNSFYNHLVGSFDLAGTPRWLTKGTGAGDDESYGLAVNPVNGEVFVTGFLQGAGLFVDGGKNVVLNKYNSSQGALLSSYLVTGTSTSQVNAGRAVALDRGGCAYVAGSYTDSNLAFPDPPFPYLGLLGGTEAMFAAKVCPDCFCTNAVEEVNNGSFESPVLSASDTYEYLTSVPGWLGVDSSSSATSLEFWNGTYGAMTAQDGLQHLEINASVANETVSQRLTRVNTNCPATFCFWYVGRPGFADNAFQVELIGSGLLPMPFNPPAYSNPGSWQRFCIEFLPPSPTLKIAFTGKSNPSITGGAHIDNVSLTQCCGLGPAPCELPAIVTQPQSVVITEGPSASHPVSFTVTASGSPTLLYGWRRNGVPLPYPPTPPSCYTINSFGNTSTLTLFDVPPCNMGLTHDTGIYSVDVGTDCGDIGSVASGSVSILYIKNGGFDQAGKFNLGITAATGTVYQVQYRNDLNPGTLWQLLTNGFGTGTNTTVADPNPNPTNRFYRVVPQSGP